MTLLQLFEGPYIELGGESINSLSIILTIWNCPAHADAKDQM